MGKFYGTIGFVKTEESEPGIWKPVTVEKGYCGDKLKSAIRADNNGKVNSDLVITDQISIICDPFALENYQFIKFVRFLGVAWTVTSVSIDYPRLTLNLGEVYAEEVENEPQNGTSD